MVRNIILIVLVSLFVVDCATVPVTGRTQIIAFPPSQMQSMSYQQYDQFLGEHKVVKGTSEAQMIKRVGSRIQKAVEAYMTEKGLSSSLQGFKWEFNLVEDDAINAWAMPGGKVVFYTGILPVCQGEEGVAVVMGHEIAHAIARHGAERMTQQVAAQGLSQTVGIATMEKSPQYQAIFNTAFGVGAQLGMLRFSRKHESEADRIGLVFSSMAGYDPRVAPKFWERMASMSKGQAPPEFLSTHPSHTTRISDLTSQLPEAIKIYEQNKGKN